MAGGDFFQMDQTAFANQKLLWHLRECCQNTNLDGGIDLCPGCHNEETAQNRGQSLHNSPDPQRHRLRKNPLTTSPYQHAKRNTPPPNR